MAGQNTYISTSIQYIPFPEITSFSVLHLRPIYEGKKHLSVRIPQNRKAAYCIKELSLHSKNTQHLKKLVYAVLGHPRNIISSLGFAKNLSKHIAYWIDTVLLIRSP